MIELRALGRIDLKSDGGDPKAILSQPKLTALLSYLAISAPGQFHRRDSLIAIFWPDSDTARARAALRSALHELRSNLPGNLVLTRGNDDLALDPARIWCDVTAFDSAIRRGDLEEAARHYTGALLPGLFLRQASEFEYWLERERDRLARAYREVLERLARAATESGDVRQATVWWRQASEADLLNSRLAGELVNALAAVGDRAGALQVAERHLAILSEEGLASDRAFSELVERVRDGSGVGSASAPAVAAAANSDAAVRTAPLTLPNPRPRSRIRLALIGAAVATAVLSVGLLINRREASRHAMPRSIQRLALLPLRTAPGDTAAASLAEGVTRETIAALTRAGAHVIAFSSVSGYGARDVPLTQIARDLQVDGVATGTLVRSATGITISVELVDPGNGEARWAAREMAQVDAIGLLASKTARQLAAAMGAPLSADDQARLVRVESTNRAAYDSYLRGTQAERAEVGIAEFRRAIELDSAFVAAYAGLAQRLLCECAHAELGISEAAAYAAADSAIRRALALNPESGVAHATLGMLYDVRDRDWVRSEREMRLGVKFDPSPAVFRIYAKFINRLGRFKDMAILFRQAALGDPNEAGAKFALSDLRLYSGDTAGALQEIKHMQAVDPRSAEPYTTLLTIQIHRGQLAEALATLSEWGSRAGVPDSSNLWRAAVLAMMGRRAEARTVLARTPLGMKRGYPNAWIAAGEPQQAYRVMEDRIARGQQFEYLNGMDLTPQLRKDPQYRALLRRIGLDINGDNGLNDGWVARQFGVAQ